MLTLWDKSTGAKPYASSKHGMAGFVDSLRRELMHEGAPVPVTNVMPGTINTPFFNNARTKIGVKPQGPPSFYSRRSLPM